MTLVGQQEDIQAKSLIKPFIPLYYYVFTPNKYHVNHVIHGQPIIFLSGRLVILTGAVWLGTSSTAGSQTTRPQDASFTMIGFDLVS